MAATISASTTTTSGTPRAGRRSAPGRASTRPRAARSATGSTSRTGPSRTTSASCPAPGTPGPRDAAGNRGPYEEALLGHAGRRRRAAARDPAHRPLVRPLHGVRRARRGREAARARAGEGPMSTALTHEPVTRPPLAACRPGELVRVYVWQWPVRLTHWLNAYSILVLALTGFYIGHPFITVSGPAGQHFVMGWVEDDPLLRGHRLRPLRRLARGVDVHGQPLRDLGQVHPGRQAPAAGAVGQPALLPVPAATAAGVRGPQPARGLHLHLRVPALLHDDRHGARPVQRERPARLAVPGLPLPPPAVGRRAERALRPSRRDVAASWPSPSTTSTARC